MRKWLILSILALAGCKVGPNYLPPAPCVPDTWQHNENVLYNAPSTDWWTLFGDPLLEQYIAMGACYNKALWAAQAHIWQARSLRQATASALYPQIIADFNVSRTYFSKNGPLFAGSTFSQGVNPVTGLPFQIQIPQIQNLYNALIDVAWEIDVFGKTARSIEAADAKIGVTIEERNALLLTILAEIATNYVEIRSNQKLGVILEQNVSLLEKNAAITRAQFLLGYRNKLDLEKIETELLNAKASLPDVYAQIVRNIFALSVLTGNLPETLMCELLPLQPLPQIPPCIAMGLRSDLLRRRPDVRQAERRLAEATANVGVAVASFFPSFTFNADFGLQSLTFRNLFQSRSKTYSIGGDVNMPIFVGGRLMGNLRATEAAMVGAAFDYQQQVLRALEETESALIQYTQELKTLNSYTAALEKSTAVVTLSQARYTAGLTPLLDLLDAERTHLTTEQNRLSSETAALKDIIYLYKALGGGWEFCR